MSQPPGGVFLTLTTPLYGPGPSVVVTIGSSGGLPAALEPVGAVAPAPAAPAAPAAPVEALEPAAGPVAAPGGVLAVMSGALAAPLPAAACVAEPVGGVVVPAQFVIPGVVCVTRVFS